MTNEPENPRTREPEDLLLDLRRELQSVKPSPAFAAGVRERIEIEKDRRARAAWWFDWRTLVATGATAAIIAAVWAANRGSGVGSHVGSQVSSNVGSHTGSNVGSSASATVSSNDRVNDRANLRGNPRVNARVNPRVDGGVSQVNAMRTAQEPPLEVITTQPAILRMLWERHREAELAFAAAQNVPTEVRDVVVVPVEVEPVVVKWLVEPPVVPGSIPTIRRLTAETAERSAK